MKFRTNAELARKKGLSNEKRKAPVLKDGCLTFRECRPRELAN